MIVRPPRRRLRGVITTRPVPQMAINLRGRGTTRLLVTTPPRKSPRSIRRVQEGAHRRRPFLLPTPERSRPARTDRKFRFGSYRRERTRASPPSRLSQPRFKCAYAVYLLQINQPRTADGSSLSLRSAVGAASVLLAFTARAHSLPRTYITSCRSHVTM